MTETVLKSIPLSKVHESRTNPRRRFDEAELAELAASIRAAGVLQPVLVRPKGKEFELVAGARRFRAALEAGLTEIPANVRELSDEQALELQLVENLQRVDVHPLDEAAGFKRLGDLPGYNVAAIAAKVGKSESYVRRRLKLADLVPEAVEACFAGQITPAVAEVIAKLRAEDQLETLETAARDADDEMVTAAWVAGWVERNIFMELARAPFPAADAELDPDAGPCTSCQLRTGANPGLFDQGDEGDRCMSRPCFKSKRDKFIERALVQATEKAGGYEPLKLSMRYGGYGSGEKKADVRYAGTWARAAKRDACAAWGVIVDAYEPEELGKVVRVCIDKKCKTHGDTPAASSVDRAKAVDRKLAKATSSALVQKTLEFVSWPPPKEVVNFAARYYVGNQGKKFFDLVGLDVNENYELAESFTADDLLRIIIAKPLVDEHKLAEYGSGVSKELKALAKGLGVDVGELERALKADLKQSANKKQKKASKKGGAK